VSTTIASAAGATRPGTSEYLPYYERYIALVPEGDVISTLATQMTETQTLLHALPASVATYRYAPEKWSVNELVGHMIDSERIFSGRALRFARNDPTPQPSFDQDGYVRAAAFDTHPLADLAAELDAVRQATIFLFRHLDEKRDREQRRSLGAGVGLHHRRSRASPSRDPEHAIPLELVPRRGPASTVLKRGAVGLIADSLEHVRRCCSTLMSGCYNSSGRLTRTRA
jgi:hypothetical protein